MFEKINPGNLINHENRGSNSELEIVSDFNTFFAFADNVVVIVIQLQSRIIFQQVLDPELVVKAPFSPLEVITADTVLSPVCEKPVVK